MASVTAVTASPATINVGGQSTITTTLGNPDRIATVTVSVDGTTGTAQVGLHENLTYSVNPADAAKTDPASPSYVKGLVVATVDLGGALAVGANGTFIFTSS